MNFVDDHLSGVTSALSDRYTIESELGRGGMAIVYRAQDIKHHRDVAIKVLRPEFTASIGVDRFLREVEIAAKLTHPHVLSLFDSGKANGFLYYVMPYVSGGSLRDLLRKEKQLPVEDALRITKEVADALGHAHSQGIVHRDIKPENIMFEGGHAVVTDFGIARAVTQAGGEKLTETGMAVGTPHYMSPEQASGDGDIDGRADVYALGCVLHEMLAGEVPFDGPTAEVIIRKHLSVEAPRITQLRPAVPEPVADALMKALAKTPADRFSTAEQFTEALVVDVAAFKRRQSVRKILRRTALAATAIVVVLAAAFGVNQLGSEGDSWRDRPLDPNTVVVLPFDVVANDSAVESLSDGIPYLFYSYLTGGTGLQAVEPNAVIRHWTEMQNRGDVTTDAAALEFATQFGAAQLIEGSVVQAGSQITLSAWMSSVPDGEVILRKSVSGSSDSSNALVSELAFGLLGERLGESEERIARIARRPQPAVQAYLAGVRADRDGHIDQALAHFDRAMARDSGFALAAMGMVKTAYKLGIPNSRFQRGDITLALRLQDQLSERDRAALNYVRVRVGRFRGDTITTLSDGLTAAVAWAELAPTDPEAALELAITLIGYGPVGDVPNWRERAELYRERSWNTDSTNPNLLRQQMNLADMSQDVDWLRRVAPVYFSHTDSTGADWIGKRWVVALLLGDSAMVSDLRARALAGDTLVVTQKTTRHLTYASVRWGLPLDDAELVAERIQSLHPDQFLVNTEKAILSIAAGRLGESDANSQAGPYGDIAGWLVSQDPSRAERAAAAAESLRGMPYCGPYCEVNLMLYGVIARGDTIGVRTRAKEIEELDVERGYEGYGPALLLATIESLDQNRNSTPALDTLEARARRGPATEPPADLGMLLVARLRRHYGDYQRALAAVRSTHNYDFVNFFVYRTAYLKEEGELAAIVGDTAGAIKAYNHYLTLRSDPDSGEATEEREEVRAALARLVER